MTTTGISGPSADELAKERLRLWLRLLKVNRRLESELRERLRISFGTTLPRFDVMAALNRHRDGMKMSELSRMLMVSNGNVTGLIDRLSEDELTQRETVAGDKRAMRVKLTPKGVAEFARQAAEHEKWVSELLSDLDGPTCARMNTILAHALPEERDRHDD